MKRFIVTSVTTEPDGEICLYGPNGVLRIKRHEANERHHEYSFSRATLVDIYPPSEQSHNLKVEDVNRNESTVF